MVGLHHQLDGHGFGWTAGVGDGQGGLAFCGSWGCKESDMTEQLNWTEGLGSEIFESCVGSSGSHVWELVIHTVLFRRHNLRLSIEWTIKTRGCEEKIDIIWESFYLFTWRTMQCSYLNRTHILTQAHTHTHTYTHTPHTHTHTPHTRF